MSRTVERLRKRISSERRFTYLLVFLLVYFVLGPVFSREAQGPSLADLIFTLVLVAAAYAASERRRVLYASVSILLPTVVVSWLVHFHHSPGLWVANHLLVILFLTYVASVVLGHVMREEAITPDKISAALCSYLLLGMIWAFLFSLLELLYPGSFQTGPRIEGHGASAMFQRSGFENAIYFSFTTLTTLGYGDVTPIRPLAQNLSVMEAVLGQVYMTVLVARLVGLEISHRSSRRSL